ncbi:hypothetical protein O3P69_005013 [Scylla paramamosain]|uniref:Uncharacterized protein n=1 Tax=Scylla paramamosain TaxID=85552 RepID=A0AAW0UAZ2_SCYPA
MLLPLTSPSSVSPPKSDPRTSVIPHRFSCLSVSLRPSCQSSVPLIPPRHPISCTHTSTPESRITTPYNSTQQTHKLPGRPPTSLTTLRSSHNFPRCPPASASLAPPTAPSEVPYFDVFGRDTRPKTPPAAKISVTLRQEDALTSRLSPFRKLLNSLLSLVPGRVSCSLGHVGL